MQKYENIGKSLYKIMFVLEGAEEGRSCRQHATTKGNRDWAWIYPHPHDLHSSYARILIGLPPQPQAFRDGCYYVDPPVYEGIRQVIPRDTDEYGCRC